MTGLRTILIGGTSHVGKTTFAAALANALGWRARSTDELGRHPGRPWGEVRPHVREFYDRLSDETVYAFLEAHHENLWFGGLRAMIEASASPGQDDRRLVLEGCALRPRFVAEVANAAVLAVWLTAPHDLIARRIRAASGFEHAAAGDRRLIERFLARSLRQDADDVAAARERGFACVDVAAAGALDDLRERCLRTMG